MRDVFSLSPSFGLSLRPEARAAATLATLHQVADLPGAADVAGRDVAAAFEALGVPRPADSAAVAARRGTLRQVAADIVTFLEYSSQPTAGDASAAAPWFYAQIQAWGDSEDPRQRAMGLTAVREIQELETSPRPFEGMAEMLP